jgi:hypothetical protein
MSKMANKAQNHGTRIAQTHGNARFLYKYRRLLALPVCHWSRACARGSF